MKNALAYYTAVAVVVNFAFAGLAPCFKFLDYIHRFLAKTIWRHSFAILSWSSRHSKLILGLRNWDQYCNFLKMVLPKKLAKRAFFTQNTAIWYQKLILKQVFKKSANMLVSMLWSQFSAIFDYFRRKNWRFSQKPVLWSNFCII
jgi:hypothetical protein